MEHEVPIAYHQFAYALANYLESFLPDITFYENPVQQQTETPCLFLQQTNTRVKSELSGRKRWEIGMELTGKLKQHIPDLQQQYIRLAQTLDEVLDTIPNSNGLAQPMRTFNRKWDIREDGLHYTFQLILRVYSQENSSLMRRMETFSIQEQ